MIQPGHPTCLFDEGPLYLCVPHDVAIGQQMTVALTVYTENNPNLPPQTCETVYVVNGNDITPVDDLPRPADFVLGEAHPNPFNPRTEIAFTLPGMPGETHETLLRIYDLRGRVVRTLVCEPLSAGDHVAIWDGRDETGQSAAGGVYLYRLEAAGRSATGKMALLK